MARSELTPQELELRKIISSKLSALLEQKNITQADLSELIKIPKSTLNGYFKGTSTPNPGNVQKLADFFEVKKSDIDPRFNKNISNIIQIKQTKSIPVLGSIACGDPILAEENISDTLAFPTELLPSGNLFFLVAQGDSMEPIIKEGSYVMIRKQENVENGEIAAVLFADSNEATLKRVKYIGENVMLEAENDAYDPIIVNQDDQPRIIGKAVKVLNSL
ncbi:LexA family protein [Facklamia sp. P13069]|uniref:LexA family protein n=1 Tax=Facklamia sp. P13069 TaxID=3421954 RepID=UPI003D183A08